MNRSRWMIWSITVLVILAALSGYLYTAHGRSARPGVTPDREKYPVVGIDVSAHNGPVDFERALRDDSVSFVYLKATEGATFQDRLFVDNYRRARKSGMAVGAYHFFRFDMAGHLQALNFLNAIHGRELDLPVAIDVESWTNPDDVAPEVVRSRLREMINYLEARDYRVMVYTNKRGYDNYFPEGTGAGTDLWICSLTDIDQEGDDGFNRQPWVIWQHNHRGSIAGVDGHVDVNTFNGSRSDFQSWLAKSQKLIPADKDATTPDVTPEASAGASTR